MKTKKLLNLLPAVFAIASILVSCTSVGFAGEKPSISYTQKIVTPELTVCVDIDPLTQCPKDGPDAKVTDCGEKVLTSLSREDVYTKFLKSKVNYMVGSTCNSFIVEVDGNTTYYCTPWRCYPR